MKNTNFTLHFILGQLNNSAGSGGFKKKKKDPCLYWSGGVIKPRVVCQAEVTLRVVVVVGARCNMAARDEEVFKVKSTAGPVQMADSSWRICSLLNQSGDDG